jgi:hypothetical protein
MPTAECVSGVIHDDANVEIEECIMNDDAPRPEFVNGLVMMTTASSNNIMTSRAPNGGGMSLTTFAIPAQRIPARRRPVADSPFSARTLSAATPSHRESHLSGWKAASPDSAGSWLWYAVGVKRR